MEIERKWIVCPEKVPYDLQQAERWEIEQHYIQFEPEIRIRRINRNKFYRTEKSKPDSVHPCVREEKETEISQEEYETLFQQKKATIVKTRYRIKEKDGRVLELDFFHGTLTGLIVLEIEFENEAEANRFPAPLWTEREVTAEENYKNSVMAKKSIN